MRNILLVSWSFFVIFILSFCARSQKEDHQVLYLSNGNLFCYDITKKITDTLFLNKDTVENFAVSPTKRYLAYEKLIKYIDLYYEIDEEDEIPTKKPYCSIVIFDLIEQKKIAEVLPKEDEFLNISNWIEDNQLLYKSGEQYQLNGWLTLNTTGIINDLGMDDLSTIPKSTVYSRDGSIKLYIDESNTLHMNNINLKKDTKLYSSPNTLYDFNISSDNKSIIWFEIVDSEDGTIDEITLLSQPDKKLTVIYSEKALGKKEKCISFSPNDSTISIELEENVIILLNIFTKEKFRINGYDVCWVDDYNFIYNKESDLFMFNIKDKSDKLFCKGAKAASFIRH